MSELPQASSVQEFDFEDWRQLHAIDPEAFERRRAEALCAVIDSAPARMQQRLRGVQFRLDMERSLARSDLAACLKAHSMMWDSLVRLRDALAMLSETRPGETIVPVRGALAGPDAPRTATVLRFPTPDARNTEVERERGN